VVVVLPAGVCGEHPRQKTTKKKAPDVVDEERVEVKRTSCQFASSDQIEKA